MSFISYAQNYEDVVLWRALKHIKNGFYVDIGANDPTADSVTKAFYEKGWSGINIDALESHYKDLLADRPRDINICCAVGEVSGNIEIFDNGTPGCATGDKSTVKSAKAAGSSGSYHSVPMRTLSDICEEHISGEIHFLKIDVEGMEKQVLNGADFKNFRPWIVVIEATKPNSTEETYKEWENILLDSDYQFAYADGLNRFYTAKEHPGLLSSFKYPPNIFDCFIKAAQIQAETRADQAEARALQAELLLNSIYKSRSWRWITLLKKLRNKLRIIRKS